MRFLTCLLLLGAISFPVLSQKALAGEYEEVRQYDPQRNAEADVQAAIAEARRSNRHLLVEVGGQWCIWCHILDKFFTDHPDLTALRKKNFVMVKVNFSPERENKKLLSQYPKIPGYPHLFVLDQNGKLLHSQDTGQLEEGKSYNLGKLSAFLEKWAPTKRP